MTIKEFSKFSDRALYAFCVVYNLIVFGVFLIESIKGPDPQLKRINEFICEEHPFLCLIPDNLETFLIGSFTFFSLFLASKNSVWKWFFILPPIIYLWIRRIYIICYPINL